MITVKSTAERLVDESNLSKKESKMKHEIILIRCVVLIMLFLNILVG